MERRLHRWALLLVAGIAALLAACGQGAPQEGTPTEPPITIGAMYDGVGATQIIGQPFKAGFEDYIRLVNRRGGVEGHPINPIIIEHSYEVPKGVDAYERMKREGAVMILTYGTPIAAALSDRCNADKIPCLTPGFGIAAAANGQKFPYVFPAAASYWSQAAASVQFVLDQWKKEGRPGKPKVAYLYWDNPAGREPLDVFKRLAEREGFELRLFPVPLPGLEVSAQVTDIVQRYRADWVITHTAGRTPGVVIKTFKEAGYPLDRVVAFVWASADADINAAGGFQVAEGYYGLQFTAIGVDHPVVKEIEKMYRDEGRTLPAMAVESNVYYMRGLTSAALMVEGLRQALRKHGYPLDGTKAKEGLESVRGDLSGLLTVRMSPQDHEGGGFLQVYQVKGGRFVLAKDWYNAYRDVINEFLQ